MTFHRRLCALLALALLLTAHGGGAMDSATLTVIVENVRSSSGSLHVAIWNEAEGFGDGERSLAKTSVPAAPGEQRIVFENLSPGRYAIAAYHDENGNEEFDRTQIGLPAEGLGFSNDAWITLLGPPSFKKAALTLDGLATDAVVRLRY